MDPIVESLTHYGLPGLVIAALLVMFVMKDRELARERDARIEDAKAFHAVVLGVQEKAISTVNRLTDVFDELKRLPPRRSP